MRARIAHSLEEQLIHVILVVPGLALSSLSAFTGFAFYFFMCGGGPSGLFDQFFPAGALIFALALDCAVARKIASYKSTTFLPSLLKTTAMVFIGMILISVLAMRENWWEIMKETFLSH